jgi:2-octaprenyl-6-methoxyphenol hydroxylase
MAVDTPTSQRFDVAISGASYAGLALARALSTAFAGAIKIAVAAHRAVPGASRKDGRAFALSAASKHMLSVLGVWERLADGAQPVEEIEITDSSLEAGVRPVLLRYDNRTADGEPAAYIVPAVTLERALNEAVASDAAVTVVAPAQVRDLSVDDYAATLLLADGRRVCAALAVAAEGRRSVLREAAGIKIVGWGYGQTGIVTTIAHTRGHRACAVQHFLPGGPFAMLPLTGDRSAITWSEESSEAERILALDDDAFLVEVDTRVGGRLGTVTLAGPRQSWPLEMHLARSYVGNRLALIGDTAHCVHPIAGQGLNLALRDVAALAEVAAEAARVGLDIGNAVVLGRYERWRRFDSTLSAAAYDGLNRLFSNDSTLLRAARDLGLGLVDRLPQLKSVFVTAAAGLAGDVPRLLRGEAV